MDVRVCRRCKKMFQYIAGPTVCPNCIKKEEEFFQLVKDYLKEKPGATMKEVSEQTGVSIPLIENFLRQGRLQVSPDSPIGISCERCGAKITTGRFCTKCSNEMIHDLTDVAKEMENTQKQKLKTEHQGEKMRFLNSKKD